MNADSLRTLFQQVKQGNITPDDAVQKLADGEEPMSEARLVEAVREQWGIPNLDVERINVMNWKMSAQVAQ